MMLSPEDHRLRKVIRDLVSENMRGGGQRVMFVDRDLNVREVLYEGDVLRGNHLRLRDELLEQGELRAILQFGLVIDGHRRAVLHVIDPEADRDRPQAQQLNELLCLRQANGRVFWVPTPLKAKEAWAECWFPGQ